MCVCVCVCVCVGSDEYRALFVLFFVRKRLSHRKKRHAYKRKRDTRHADKKREKKEERRQKTEERIELHTRTTPLQIRMAVLEQFMHPQRICATSLRVSLTQLMRLTSLSPTVYVLRLSLILCGERMQPPPLHPHTCARASCRSVQMQTHRVFASPLCGVSIHHTHAEYVTYTIRMQRM